MSGEEQRRTDGEARLAYKKRQQMNIESVDASDNIEKLLKLKPRESYVWAAMKCKLFKTYDGYFGQFTKPFRDTSYDINCIEGTSPLVYKLKKLVYVGAFEAKQSNNMLFIFYDMESGFQSDYYVLPYDNTPYLTWSLNEAPYLSCDAFGSIDKKHLLDIELIAFNEEDGLKICRELNRNWSRDMRFIGFTETGKYIKKTLESMMQQLDCFMKSEYMIDPAKEVENDLNSFIPSNKDEIWDEDEDEDEDY